MRSFWLNVLRCCFVLLVPPLIGLGISLHLANPETFGYSSVFILVPFIWTSCAVGWIYAGNTFILYLQYRPIRPNPLMWRKIRFDVFASLGFVLLFFGDWWLINKE